jgi:hypothetical protein
MTRLAGSRHRIEGPQQRTGICIEGPHLATHAELTAGEAGHHEALVTDRVVQRRRGDAEALGPVLGGHVPDWLTAALVERLQPRIDLSHEHLAVSERHTATGPADGVATLWIGVALVLPQHTAGFHIECEDVVHAVGNVERTGVVEDLRLAGVLVLCAGPHGSHPQRLELTHIEAIDLAEWRIALVVGVAAVGDPLLGGQRRELCR